jgi:DNA integrity scanning protein DisA with diadenylate cyclase activity
VKPVAKVVEKLDSAALSLVERLAGDLTQLGENSRDLKVQVSTLSDDLDHEKQLLERLRVENQRLLKANSELRAQVSHRETKDSCHELLSD